ncbi:putative NUDIX family phosphoesterase [Desulfobotulus alkaliphilus]|uniref:Putative NUDIX family phosphoesterase n=1 Tax=Desulfobotulus alkaliphilus TaxID=622671 RepID=A0A562R6Y3_9BACT|nr:NUDIX domain-containing protein [Desulfobotulus alkaliphilus]TWI64805.1 putative NUDIX family phosphoesterase [Desulfobotulus alkaliphilus]
MEKILCFKKNLLPPDYLGRETALKIELHEFSRIVEGHQEYQLRGLMEENTDYKQIIPYALIRDTDNCFFVYPRKGSEARLHGLKSCGIGGHVSSHDEAVTLEQTIHNCLKREIFEETGLKPKVFTFLGYINEEIHPVGHFHCGLVFFCEVKDREEIVLSTEITQFNFMEPERLLSENLELWSRLALSLV